MFDTYQVCKPVAHGADFILIIMASPRRCRGQIDIEDVDDCALQDGVAIEIHSAAELDRAFKTSFADDRLQHLNLRTFDTTPVDQRAAWAADPDYRLNGWRKAASLPPPISPGSRASGCRPSLSSKGLMRQADRDAATRALLARRTRPAHRKPAKKCTQHFQSNTSR